MSQQKVDRYKKQKNDREKIQRREKWELRLEKLAIAVVCIAMVGWIGYSAYDLVTREDPNAEQEVVTTEMDVTALTDYLSSLSQTDTE
ncbi:MAG TPA: hypothetical protein H9747_01155 [Candidatus Blautia stercorigallinarum]|uniref:Uncharacterized protein n=1 Tax=Candidatus Blautia stercorigallinarum TaxID=2838501 RepID=A0A9D1PAW4_9FIRM|nr:hypothetical protein [Candidatus Blautia stercorigallinarum]